MLTNQKIVDFINALFGFQTEVKTNIHFPTMSNAVHLHADELYDEIGNYVDTLAEGSQFFYGRMEAEQYNPIITEITDLVKMVEELIRITLEFRKEIESENDPRNYGILSLTDDFIHKLSIIGYRAELK